MMIRHLKTRCQKSEKSRVEGERRDHLAFSRLFSACPAKNKAENLLYNIFSPALPFG
jgi:hypothetical protein